MRQQPAPMGDVPGTIETDPIAFIRAYEALPTGGDVSLRAAADENGEPFVVVHLERRTFALTCAQARTLADIFADAVARFRFTSDGLPDLIMALRAAANESERALTGGDDRE